MGRHDFVVPGGLPAPIYHKLRDLAADLGVSQRRALALCIYVTTEFKVGSPGGLTVLMSKLQDVKDLDG